MTPVTGNYAKVMLFSFASRTLSEGPMTCPILETCPFGQRRGCVGSGNIFQKNHERQNQRVHKLRHGGRRDAFSVLMEEPLVGQWWLRCCQVVWKVTDREAE